MSNHQARDIAGSTVAITGATSGIGRATDRALATAGANTVLLGRRKERLDDLVAELGADRTVAVCGDVGHADTSERMVRAAVDSFGALDSLVANAGTGAYGGIMDLSDDDIIQMAQANFLGTVWSVRAAVPVMKQRGGGDIVVVSSVAGLRGGANEAVYAATKFAQVGLAGAVDRELRELHIRVTTICPAAVNTEFAIGAGRTAGDSWLDEVMQPEDVAAAIVYSLAQPRRLRTQTWSLSSMAEGS